MPVLYNKGESAELPAEMSFLSVKSQSAVLSSVKQCEDGEGFVVRLWNGTDKPAEAQVSLFRPVSKAWVSNIHEERLEEIKPSELLAVKNLPPRR